MTTPLISVVVPTHQRRDAVIRLLAALRDGELASDRFEVVVVVDGSTDGTTEALAELSLPFALRVLQQSSAGGAARARNLGAGAARGTLLVFMDDDIQPATGCLAEHVRAHEHHGAAFGDAEPLVLIGAPIPVRSATDGFHQRAIWGWWEQQFERLSAPGQRMRYDDVYSGVLSMRATLFNEVGGFETGLPSSCRDDSEIGLRLIARGARIVFSRSAGGLHHETRDRTRLIARKVAEGEADVMLARLHPELWSSLRLSWPEAPVKTGVGLLRRLAFDAPRGGDLTARAAIAVLDLLERLRVRHLWRQLNAGVMYYWYWRGVRLAVGDRAGLRALADVGRSSATSDDAPLVIDLHDGVEAAAERVDQVRPVALRVRYDGLPVGDIPAVAGAERLRGAHLRTAIADSLAAPLLAALSLSELAAPNDTDTRGVVATPTQANAPASASTDADTEFAVSVIVPAYRAESTIGATLDSLLAQSMPHWEAIVVDDGSDDATASVVERYVAMDPRIMMIRQANAGLSAARNAGIAAATHAWLLFLDADDTIHPSALALVRDTLRADATLDAVHYGWAIIDAAGTVLAEERCEAEGDLFDVLACRCAFPVHACVVRRSLVSAVGGFDPAMAFGEDWPLWQRIARRGARFGRVPATLAYYLKRDGSMSSNTEAVLERALRTVALGHSNDPVAGIEPGAPYYEGRLASSDAVVLNFVCWAAGTLLGQGADPTVVLRHLAPGHPVDDPTAAAECIVYAAPLAVARRSDAWRELWDSHRAPLDRFLLALESHAARPGLARVMIAEVQRQILPWLASPLPGPVAGTSVADVEIIDPFDDRTFGADVERLHLRVSMEGEALGVVEVPVSDGIVTADAIRDAIAERFAWVVLGRYFERTAYTELECRQEGDEWSWWRGDALVARVSAGSPAEAFAALHDAIGWETFLAELSPREHPLIERAWSALDKLTALLRGDDDGRERGMPRHHVVELGEPPTGVVIGGRNVAVELRAANAVVASTEYVVGRAGIVSGRALRSAAADAADIALCRVVVREALIGAPLDTTSLSERLARLLPRGDP